MTQLYAPYYETITNVINLGLIAKVRNALNNVSLDNSHSSQQTSINPTTLQELFDDILSVSETHQPTDKLYIYHDGSRKTQDGTFIGIINPVGQNLLPSTTLKSSYDGKYFIQMGGHPINIGNIANAVYYFQDWTDISDNFPDKYEFNRETHSYTGYEYFLGKFYHFNDGTPYKWYIIVRHRALDYLIGKPHYTTFDAFTIYAYDIQANQDAVYQE